jgi:hypothetical protein
MSMPKNIAIPVSSKDGYTLFMMVEYINFAGPGPHKPHVTYMVTGPNGFCVSNLPWDDAVKLFREKTSNDDDTDDDVAGHVPHC